MHCVGTECSPRLLRIDRLVRGGVHLGLLLCGRCLVRVAVAVLRPVVRVPVVLAASVRVAVVLVRGLLLWCRHVLMV